MSMNLESARIDNPAVGKRTYNLRYVAGVAFVASAEIGRAHV